MKLSTPRWWYVREGAPAPVMRALLKPVSWIWAAATARRIAKAQPVDPGAPVTVVCMLTSAPTGTTTVVPAGGAHVVCAAPAIVHVSAVLTPLMRSATVIEVPAPGAVALVTVKVRSVARGRARQRQVRSDRVRCRTAGRAPAPRGRAPPAPPVSEPR